MNSNSEEEETVEVRSPLLYVQRKAGPACVSPERLYYLTFSENQV